MDRRVNSVLLVTFVTVLVFVAAPGAQVQPPIPSYYDQLQFNITSPTARATASSGFANPAMYYMLPGSELQINWSGNPNRFGNESKWGVFLGGPGAGFGILRSEVALPGGGYAGVNDMRIAISGGTKRATMGIAYGWSTGEDEVVGRAKVAQIGAAHRVSRYTSFGLLGNFSLSNSYMTGVFDLAVRPLGDQRLTLFADAELPKGISVSDAPWSLGAMLEIPSGLQLTGRYFEDEAFAVSIGLAFGGVRVTGSPQFNKDSDRTNTNWELRAGFWEKSFIQDALFRDRTYMKMDLKGPVSYRTFKYFDPRHSLYEVLTDLEAAKTDPAVSGVAVNLSGARLTRGKAWEIRDALMEVRAQGKHVVIFADYIGMTELHLTSVADRVILDPQALVLIPGYLMNRTYVADGLRKIGLGFDEWRMGTYKSAVETFSRTSMSEADRQQRLELIEDLYATVREEVTETRNVSTDQFDAWIDDHVLISPKEALELGIVDKLGRWSDVRDVIEELEGSYRYYVGPSFLEENRIPSRTWGENPQIAVVYALGECAMDSGIRARELEKVMHKLARDGRVKAVVLRVDSPGGSAMASDVVAVAMRECGKNKPVIVSQGDVAASGGYWLSMYGNTIYTLPTTITGSIGVIGGWVWNDGIGEKLGHVADHVKVGENADFGAGINLLLAGPRIPDKNLSPEQREKVMDEMRTFYEEFIDKVAEARDMPTDRTASLAEGRVYSGDRAIDLGLVDEIGSLTTAIDAARRAAGLEETEVDIVELPDIPAFDFAALRGFRYLGALFGRDDVEHEVDYSELEWRYIRAIVDAPGRPLYMMPPEMYIEEANASD